MEGFISYESIIRHESRLSLELGQLQVLALPFSSVDKVLLNDNSVICQRAVMSPSSGNCHKDEMKFCG